jgi:adenine-specific DNA-methyltransferase
VLDEIMGRSNRVSIVTFKQASATGHKAINPGVVSVTNFILIYSKNKSQWSPNKVFTARSERDKRYGQFIENYDEPFETWRFITLTTAFAQSLNLPERGIKKYLADEYEEKLTAFVSENANRVIRLARPDYQAVSGAARGIIDKSKAEQDIVFMLSRENYSDMYFFKGERILFYSHKLKMVDGKYVSGEPLTSLWDDILSNNIHNEGGVEFPKGKKPEALIKRCLELSTSENDIVLDSFLGSGTTAAVAHKMGRQYIGIEFNGQAYTHCYPRLKAVVDGEQGGVSKAVNWQGGGFKFYELAPTLIVADKHGQSVISDKYNPQMLVAAVAKLNGFSYAPDTEVFWKQGKSQENSFIYVTTRYFTAAQLDDIAGDLPDYERLLICAPAFDLGLGKRYDNIDVRKIPLSVLSKCEYGVDNYNLNIISPPEADDEEWDDVEQ